MPKTRFLLGFSVVRFCSAGWALNAFADPKSVSVICTGGKVKFGLNVSGAADAGIAIKSVAGAAAIKDVADLVMAVPNSMARFLNLNLN